MAIRTRSQRRAVRPAVEDLESRELLSSARPSISALAVAAVPIVTQLPTAPTISVSTVPANGDVNPYGTAFVPAGFPSGGLLHPGDVLVSNFNNANNLQGTGSTIVDVNTSGQQSLFFQGNARLGTGLSTALGVLKSGFVIVGSVPSTDGTSATAMQGSLIVLNKFGNVVTTFSSPTLLNGPWDMTVVDEGSHAQLFVSNVLSGTVTRVNLFVYDHNTKVAVVSAYTIASGYTHRGDPAAFEIGPTGLAFNPKTDTLYVASTGDNAVFSIPNALFARRSFGVGRLVYADPVNLHGPLGMMLLPNGNLMVANGDGINTDPNHPSELTEFTTKGAFVGQFSIDPNIGGAFGIAIAPFGSFYVLAAVDDVTSTVELFAVRK